jgi:uncharacterized protein (TIGR01777 family)
VTFSRRLVVPVPVEQLFAWHERPGAFERLSPPWDRPRVLLAEGGIRDGARVRLSVQTGPVRTIWEIEHEGYVTGRQFCDVMRRGPFAAWRHVHAMQPHPLGSELEDRIDYRLPGGALGALVGGRFTERTLARVFRYRHAVTAGDLARHAAFADRPRLRVAITGATGFVGSALAAFLSTGGHTVVRIGRGPVRPGAVDVSWDPARGVLDPAALAGVDAVVHLAGAPIARRWTAAHRAAIRDSRVQGTRLLADVLARMDRPPAALLSGSAIGVYGSQGDAVLDERAPVGTGFLAEVGAEWEAATAPAAAAGIRVVLLRTGIVQGAAGGALAVQAPLFQLGVGGRIGHGGQWLSPIALDDEVGAIHHCLMDARIAGAVNLVGPEPVTNAQYTRTLARVLRRPAVAAVPAWAMRLVMGRAMAEETVLASQRVVPGVLAAHGFRFRFPNLESMLRFELGRGS